MRQFIFVVRMHRKIIDSMIDVQESVRYSTGEMVHETENSKIENNKSAVKTARIHELYDFQWEVLDVIIGGKSLIDSHYGLTGLPMRNADDADRFLRSYGFDCGDPIEGAEALGNFHEAVKFIQKHFLYPENPEGLKIEIPKKILALTDMRDLLLMANLSYPGQMNDTHGLQLRNWSCSILKVIHSIVHIDKDLRSSYFADIQKQILDRFYKVIHRGDDGLYLGASSDDPLRVELVDFETKSKKSRDSVILKLLHKPESVADEIFDQVGMRFVTKTRLDVLRCIKYLKDQLIIMPVNIKPSRSRNSLINVENLQADLDMLFEKAERGEVETSDFKGEVEKIIRVPDKLHANPHSSQDYRAVQFTCRQLIKLKNPVYDQLKELRGLAKKKAATATDPDMKWVKKFSKMDLSFLHREVRFFYPYEVQIFDEASWRENEEGSGAHSEYKKAQTRTALKRVMGVLADANKE